MNDESNFDISSRKNNITRTWFVILCVGLSIICAIIISTVLAPSIEGSVCGFVPAELIAVCCAIGQLAGTIYYIKKYKYASNYEWYQVINSVIYGIQNVLKILLVVALLNLFLIPVLAILGVIYGMIYIRRIFR